MAKRLINSIFNKDLPKSKEQINEQLTELYNLHKSDDQKVFEYLYNCLSILDSKSSLLLAFNAMILVVYTINFNNFETYTAYSKVLIYLGIFLISGASMILLYVVWVHWSTADSMTEPRQHNARILETRTKRTIFFRAAWFLSYGSILTMLLFVISTLLNV